MEIKSESSFENGMATVSMEIVPDTPKPQKLSPPRIVCAACRNAKGEIVCSPRHHDSLANAQMKRARYNHFVILYRWLTGKGTRNPEWMNLEQGFVDQHCNFYTRAEAWVIARKNNQIIKLVGNQVNGDEDPEIVNTVTTQIPMFAKLYSENLY